MIVAVTGGTGFIGSRLVRALSSAGHEVRVLTRKPVESLMAIDGVRYSAGDLTTDLDLSGWLDGVEMLFHCAGEISDPSRMEELHIAGTQRLVNAASGRVRRWIQLSSTGAYGPRRAGKVLESDAPNPIGPYESTKVQSDGIVLRAAERGAFSIAILRPSIVYGAAMPNRSLYAMLRMIEKGLFFFIGRPGASANYIHVDNVVHALLSCGFNPEADGQIFNLSDHCSMEAFVRMAAKSLGVSHPWLRLPEFPVRLLAHLLEAFPAWPLKVSRINALTSFAYYPISKEPLIYSVKSYNPPVL